VKIETQISDGDHKEYFAENKIFRDAAVMPRIVGFGFVVSLKPVVTVGYPNARAIWDNSSADLDYSLADANLRVDWLHCDHNIVLFERIEVPKPEPIDDNNISRADGRLHRHPVSVANGHDMLFDDIVCSYNGNDSEVGHDIFPH
jgi:hypothetical protein